MEVALRDSISNVYSAMDPECEYEKLKAERQCTMSVHVRSAYELKPAQEQQIVAYDHHGAWYGNGEKDESVHHNVVALFLLIHPVKYEGDAGA